MLGGSYSSHLADATAGSELPASALATAQDSVGAGYAVAQGIGEQAKQSAPRRCTREPRSRRPS